MSFNHQEFPKYMRTAGKITVVTALTGLLVFVLAFIFDVGTKELSKVSAAGNATTTLTVLNTPPEFTLSPYEVIGSATTTPTNSGDTISWSAIGSDSNGAPYFLLVCSTNATPTANQAPDAGSLGTVPPNCYSSPTTTQWGVSTGTVSGALATVSTTTTESAPFNEVNNWYAWVCDDDPVLPRCNAVPEQGLYSTSSSPFHVNKRPVLTDFYNNGPVDPGDTLTFYSTSSDPDTNYDNGITLIVCGSNSYSTTTNTCTADFLASSSIPFTDDAYATVTIPAIMIDQSYSAFGFLVDEFGHEAAANPISDPFDVNNVAPVVSGGDIKLNAGVDMTLTQPGTETTGFTLDFKVKDANSCLNSASSSEIVDFDVVVFRGAVGTSTCDGTAGSYDPNDCYPNGLATTTWNLTCSATTTCLSPYQDEIDYACTFPLWFLADP
ncbi:hypothetical protein KC872_02365, partial [Candidatus Kaiserbacteria bacterium]|nr:hypothetical protein [Candidatus Kaiserbacteria bacterium]